MTEISNFHLQLNNVDYAATQATAFDLMIVESGYYSTSVGLSLSQTEIAALQDQGRTVVAYLNVSVTDHLRSYWADDAWVTFTDPANRDVGPVNAAANPPDWLTGNHGYATDGATTFGYIVDYADPVWQAEVIAQATHMVTSVANGGLGYDGLFLDDVGRYFQAQSNDASYSANEAADDMIALVSAIATAVEAINPDVYISINGGTYVGADSTGGTATADYIAFVDHVDAFLMENQYDAATGSSAAWLDTLTNYAGGTGTDFLALESRGAFTAAEQAAFYDFMRVNGILGLVTPDAAYDIIQALPPTGTTANDQLDGGDGPNIIDGLSGDDTIDGGGGQDTVTAGTGADDVQGGARDDMLSGGAGNDTVSGGDGDDTLEGNAGSDTLSGDNGDDVISGASGNDLIDGLTGADTIDAGSGNDTLRGGDGADMLSGVSGSDVIEGGNGADSILGGNGFDTVTGGAGADTIDGGLGLDVLSGGDANDVILGNAGSDTINGDDGADTLEGQGGNDVIFGGAGADSLSGGVNSDTLDGGAGADTLQGDLGADTFVFDDLSGADTINDFNNNVDVLDVSAVTAITDFTQFTAAATDVGSTLVVTLSASSQLTLLNVQLSDLDSLDFVF